MPIRTWNSAGSTDMNDGANYTGSGALLTTDDLVFDNTSVVNAAANTSLEVNSITVNANYTGNLSWAGCNMTLSGGNAVFNGTGQTHFGNGFIFNGASANLTIGSGVGTVSATLCTLVFNGTTGCSFTDNKTTSFKNLTLGTNAVLTLNGSANTTIVHTSSPLNFTNGGTLTINVGLSIRLTSTGDAYTVSAGTPTVNGSGDITFFCRNSTITTSLPALTISGTVTVYFYGYATSASTHTIQLTGDFSAPTIIAYSSNAMSFTFDQNGYKLTVGDFTVGNSSSGYFKLYFDDEVEVNTFTSDYLANAVEIYLQTSEWTVKGNFTYKSDTTLDVGTSLFTFTTNDATITSNGKSFYDVDIDASGKTVDLNDAIDITGDLTIIAGTFDSDGFNVTVDGNVIINDTADLTSSICTFGGNYTNDIGSTVTTTGATFTFTKDGAVIYTSGKSLPQCTFNNNATFYSSCTIHSIIWGVDGKTLTFQAEETFTLSNLSAANWNGSAENLNKLRSTNEGTQYNLVIPADVSLEYMDVKDAAIMPEHVIYVDDGTSIDGGNNNGWVFPDAHPENEITRFGATIGIGLNK